ncbi:hypothetical protein [Paractinoplanes lichenicola]|uniref:Lipoprotein n=1 Tax=Paractinoplanes lichenicola TaxID=2802976 RepID=A0ABS1VTG4_9ACTN|nr:hypothetical protein [Actinoplanes lichenicola]MBL7257765.1 hypothetical protein [Actinoplanes lichenicola]
MRLGLLAVAIAVLAAGCTASSPAQPPAAVPSRPPAALPTLAAATTSFPLDAYMLKPAAANDLDVVLDRLTIVCLRRFDQAWPGDDRNEFDLLRAGVNRFGLADDDLAASLGYHWDSVPPAEPSPELRRHLGGCTSEAARKLGWAPAEFAWLRQLNDQTLQQAFADPRALAVTARWSSCMAKTGSPYARPADAESDPRWRGSAAPSADERRVARADVGCKQQVAFTATLSAALAAEQDNAVRGNRTRLEAFRSMAARAVAKADTLRGDHQSPAPGGQQAIPPGNWRTEHARA